ncbi:MAG TPA: hypothetical protein VL092_06860 [Chitinophagaceae bacterium]|nr:hypothetical protein [Chitinophagaceae bacterium]
MKQSFYALPFAAFFLALSASSCQQSSSDSGVHEINDTVEAVSSRVQLPPVAIVPVGTSPEFPKAQLTIASAKGVAQGADSVKVSFAFSVKNYELKGQTPDAGSKNCNNSDKGQHIHFILDNQPYVALYEPKHEITLAKNTEHYLMCFLSRSYHESVKSKGAATVYHFKIDEQGKLVKLDDPKTPMLFYSRPKGDYLGKDTANLLLDFYVWNANLGADYKVKTMVSNSSNAQQKEMLIDTWQPMFIQNLGTGKASVSLTLVDKDGNEVQGPMTKVSRNIQMAAQEPLQ